MAEFSFPVVIFLYRLGGSSMELVCLLERLKISSHILAIALMFAFRLCVVCGLRFLLWNAVVVFTKRAGLGRPRIMDPFGASAHSSAADARLLSAVSCTPMVSIGRLGPSRACVAPRKARRKEGLEAWLAVHTAAVSPDCASVLRDWEPAEAETQVMDMDLVTPFASPRDMSLGASVSLPQPCSAWDTPG